uniref:Uncharacterized protein n=1 Tax=Pleurozia purpurea TaxID=280637 RepID=D0R046_9MARC|nr:hypothetical protein PlpuMp47 [Pleurozia purpurea]ACR19383.1 hypothetical protein PlpuMp47 [Pleurozia purpurea]
MDSEHRQYPVPERVTAAPEILVYLPPETFAVSSFISRPRTTSTRSCQGNRGDYPVRCVVEDPLDGGGSATRVTDYHSISADGHSPVSILFFRCRPDYLFERG